MTDVRLSLGFASVIVAAVASYYDYKVGFEAAKKYTAIAVGAYFLLNALMTLWVWKVEAGIVYQGIKGGVKVGICIFDERKVDWS